MVAQADLPDSLRTQSVTAWLGAKLHVVQYPVRRGELVNVVAVVEGRQLGNPQGRPMTPTAPNCCKPLAPCTPNCATCWKQ